MAQEEQQPQKGYRYLLDAQNKRQYAVQVVNGRPFGQTIVAAGNALALGETAYAYDDEVVLTEKRDPRTGKVIGGFVTARLWEITRVSQTGEDRAVEEVIFEFRKTPAGTDPATGEEKFRYSLIMTPESRAALKNLGFATTGYPLSYENIRPGTDAATGKLKLVFPPQHPSHQAEEARVIVYNKHAREAEEQFRKAASPTNAVTPPNNRLPQQPVPPQKQPDPPKVSDAKLTEFFDKYGKDYTALAKTGKLDPVVGREQETTDALKILMRRKQSSVCVTGDAGSGKTAMFTALAQELVDREAMMPNSLKGARVIELDMGALTAGTRFRGDLEERLKVLTQGLAEREGVFQGRKIILAIDEIHSALNMGGAEGTTGIGEQLKPFLTQRGISIIGATTDDEYRKHIENNAALGRRFRKLRLTNLSDKATITVLKALWPATRKHHSLTQDLSDDDLAYIVTSTTRYVQTSAQPSISEDVMNTAAASAEFAGRRAVSRDDIDLAIAKLSNLPVEFIGKSDVERYLSLEDNLKSRIFGQDQVIKTVQKRLIGSRAGLNDPNQPQGVFIFQGPTGVGKTELAKALAEAIFGDEKALIVYNGADYAEKHSVTALTGAPPSFVGYDDASGLEAVRNRPYSVVLFDEIEKAHPDIFDIFLPIMQDGEIKDKQGRTISFKNTIIIFTTNLGAKQAQAVLSGNSGGIGFGETEKSAEELLAEITKIYEKAMSEHLKPEVQGRVKQLGGIATFVPLPKSALEGIALAEVNKLNKSLAARDRANLPGLRVELTQAALDQVVNQGYKPTEGARALRGIVSSKIGDELGGWLLRNKEEVLDFIAANGAAKLVVSDIDNVKFKLAKDVKAIKAQKLAAPNANDNAEESVVTVKPAAPKRSAGPGPAP